tara:strand:- start:983 stop:1294 length:312 start_codon:yes stop_codon:yes gene_type:complete
MAKTRINRKPNKGKGTKKYKKTKGCGCKLPRFFGGKKTRKHGKSKNLRKKQRGGNGLSNLVPSDINNLGRSIMYTFNKNVAIAGGHDLPSNPSPLVQNEMDKH